ncbi:MAG: TonB-dependent receptor [Phenylobacterium sp.]|jgi:iron complex outermembrane receptor protein|nr:TonB-dependent receptor [Phenylobacterium sp.]MDB5461820.1 TonB-dependent receptor [Phenylobacterium sp.]
MISQSVRIKRNLMLSTCAFAISAAAASSALAQRAAPSAGGGATLETVIVTAERRGTDVQRTPDAVTSISSTTLDQSFTTSVAGLNAVVPSLEVTKTSGFENLVTVRGVGSGTPENGLTTVPGVSQFIDGVYIANTISLDQTLFDVQSVEVLRGPQGALYGQSSIGGAINIITRQPRLGVYDASGDASFGTYNLSRVRAEVNLPLSETLALRLSGQKYDHDGFTDNLAIPGFKLDDAHDASLKGALLWKPTDTFSATLSAEFYRSDQHGDAQKNIVDTATDPRKLSQDYPSHFKLESQLEHLNLQWDLPNFSIRSVSAYQGLDHIQQEDSDRSTFAQLGFYDAVAAWNTHVHNYTQELDFLSPQGSKFEWIVGLFGLYQTSKQYVVEFGGSTPPTPALLTILPGITNNPPPNLNYGNVSHVLRRSYSIFGQATYHVSDVFRVTAGVRYNNDDFKDNSYNFSAFSTNTVIHSLKDNVPTWRAEADYDLTPDNMIYASYARGYKPGGVNGSFGQVVIPPTFKAEKNDAFELGSKNSFFDRSLRLNIAAFYYQHKDFQYIETDPVPFDAGITNIPKIRDYGVEFEAQYVGLGDHLRLGGSLALEKGEIQGKTLVLDSTVVNAIENNPSFSSPCAFGGAFYNPACWAAVIASARDVSGKEPPAMPQVSGSVNASYRWDLPTGALTARAQYTYRGSEWARIFNEPTLDKVKSYGVADLYVEYAPTGGHWRISLTGTNLFDKAGVNSRYTDPYGTGQTSQQYIPPRQVIGTIAFAF